MSNFLQRKQEILEEFERRKKAIIEEEKAAKAEVPDNCAEIDKLLEEEMVIHNKRQELLNIRHDVTYKAWLYIESQTKLKIKAAEQEKGKQLIAALEQSKEKTLEPALEQSKEPSQEKGMNDENTGSDQPNDKTGISVGALGFTEAP